MDQLQSIRGKVFSCGWRCFYRGLQLVDLLKEGGVEGGGGGS